MDFLGGATKPRDYSDLKKGSFQEEAAMYANAKEVKAVSKDGYSIATFGGGCFWGVELAFARVPGVIATSVGYAQGKLEHPGYELVCTGATGHTEVVQLTYDPKKVEFKELVRVLFTRINPSLKDQVGNDHRTLSTGRESTTTRRGRRSRLCANQSANWGRGVLQYITGAG
jgi:peptide-methionine (S)-S-oxide reductase